MIRAGTPGSEGLLLLFPLYLMSAGLAVGQELAEVVGTAHVLSSTGIQEHTGCDGSSMIRSRMSYAQSRPQAGGSTIKPPPCVDIINLIMHIIGERTDVATYIEGQFSYVVK